MGLLSRRHLVGLAVLGSAALLSGAFFFQHVMGLAPCPLCIWQRWPHAAAIVFGGLALVTRKPAPVLVLLATIALSIGAGIAGYHVGVEQGLWASATCSTPPMDGLSPTELLAQIQASPAVACDEIVWSFAGISMAGWNGIASMVLVVMLVATMLWRPKPTRVGAQP